uniref:Uncharacterized protein n=1 Tax=Arundo donax TaxID=35708 RepID=A0A0A9BNA7_ARUDO
MDHLYKCCVRIEDKDSYAQLPSISLVPTVCLDVQDASIILFQW